MYKVMRLFMGVIALLCISSALAGVDVKSTRDGFTLNQTKEFSQSTSYMELLGGGEVTSWWSQNISETMKTSVIPNRLPANQFEVSDGDWTERLLAVEGETNLGRMTFREAIEDPRAGLKAVIILREGKVVFEEYPGLRPADSHLWASVAKPAAALVIEQLIDEGLLTDDDLTEAYLPDFKGSALGNTKIVELLNMVPGTDTHDSAQSRLNPDSTASRYYRAEFGEPYRDQGVETVRDILRQAEKIRNPGEVFEYSSGITQMLVFIAEAVTGKVWADAFDDMVWSHVRADGALQVHLAPDGMAAAHGIVSSRLRDLARFGLLYTPYWPLVADKQVVSKAAMDRILRPAYGNEIFMRGDGVRFTQLLGEMPISNSRQWDAVYPDGGIFKGGLFGQGLYVSPHDGVVIAFYSTVHNAPMMQLLRPLAKVLTAEH